MSGTEGSEVEDCAQSPSGSSRDGSSVPPSPLPSPTAGGENPDAGGAANERPTSSTATEQQGSMSSVDKALFRAATDGDPECAAEVLKAGADPNAVYRAGMSPLHMACWGGHEEIVVRLLSAKADPSALNGKGQSALHLAAWQGRASILGLVAQHCDRATLDIQDLESGNTALHVAAYQAHQEVTTAQ